MDAGNYVRFVAALIFVLGLIALATWLARRFGVGGVTKGVCSERPAAEGHRIHYRRFKASRGSDRP